MKPSIITTNLEQIIKQIAQGEITRLSNEVTSGDGTNIAANRQRMVTVNFINPGEGVDGTGTTIGAP